MFLLTIIQFMSRPIGALLIAIALQYDAMIQKTWAIFWINVYIITTQCNSLSESNSSSREDYIKQRDEAST